MICAKPEGIRHAKRQWLVCNNAYINVSSASRRKCVCVCEHLTAKTIRPRLGDPSETARAPCSGSRRSLRTSTSTRSTPTRWIQALAFSVPSTSSVCLDWLVLWGTFGFFQGHRVCLLENVLIFFVFYFMFDIVFPLTSL